MNKLKKKKTTNIVLIVVFILGLCLMLYPIVSNFWNKNYTSRLITEYDGMVTNSNQEEYDRLFNEAVKYNESLVGNMVAHNLSKEEEEKYHSFLNITGNGMMGYIEIPSIDVRLPIYHGTEESILQVAVGHLGWSSLPVGGETSHCIISGHRGLPSAKLFSDLDELVEGDYFKIKVLNRTLWYEVDKISIVEPDKLDDLTLVNGKDYFTLVTCTPYGINTHRLLVRGHRVTDVPLEKVSQGTSDETEVSPILISIMILALLSLVGLSLLLIIKRRKKK